MGCGSSRKISLALSFTREGRNSQSSTSSKEGPKTKSKTGQNGECQKGSNGECKKGTLNGSDEMSKNDTDDMKRGEEGYDYDLIVIGGGSGGLAASKEAATLGKKVAVFDFVVPTPLGTKWGLGGACVNVGCIPKKLMHQAAILGHNLEDARKFGWEVPQDITHNWERVKNAVQDYIGSINFGYRIQLRDKKVDYYNAYAEFVDKNTIKATNGKGKVIQKTAQHFIIATGERPRYPDIPGAQDCCITSDDLFSLPYCPGKTLMVGASYVSLECGGFLEAFGMGVTVMVRSILLRGFDQQMAERIWTYMEAHGVKFVRSCVPTRIEKICGGQAGQPGLYKVFGKYNDGKQYCDVFNTIIFAIGRDPCTNKLGLENVGVNLTKNGFVIVDEAEQTNIPNIYAIGDILEGKPELTPVAIQGGRLLARRLYNNETTLCDYINVCTTVFTPLEYGCCGYSEEDAIEKYGEDKIEVYHTNIWPLEWTVAKREKDACYAKLICLIPEKEKVIGFHVLGPNAGEITQGFGVAMKLGATKADFDKTIGIHPTCAETFVTMNTTKRSGSSIEKTGC